MSYSEDKGLGILIFIIGYGIYFLFKTYTLYSIIITSLIVVYLIWKNYFIPVDIYEGETNSTFYIDSRGYERNKIDNRLVHRDVAWKQIYNVFEYPERFGSYVIHHIDGNKRNNDGSNLKILTKKEHAEMHGFN